MKRNRKDTENEKLGISRRAFMGQASCAAVGTTAMFSSILDMGMFNAVAQSPPGDYKALVCLFLNGGADSYNIVVPRGDAEYADYAATREDLALPQDSLLPINPATNPDGREYGLHPGMPEIQQLFEQGNAAIVANVGTLIEYMNMEQYRSRSVPRPVGLFSHSDQQMHWQTSLPDSRNAATGWIGRMADILGSLNTNQNVSMNISLNGSNILQTGATTTHYTINQNGSTGLRGYQGSSALDLIRTEALDSLIDWNYQNLFERTYAAKMRGAIDTHVDFGAALDAVPPFQTQFSDTGLSRRMEQVARTIAARQALGFSRQTFFVSRGGWDHHDDVINNQANMLPEISAALSEFYSAMVELGLENDVTAFTSTDFARTLTSNGRGSDHAWGGNQIVVGGGIQGGDIFGTYPDLALGSALDTGRGRLIPTTAVDEYFAELALWYGVAPGDLSLVLPNIGNFYSPSRAQGPVGFLNPGPGTGDTGTPGDPPGDPGGPGNPGGPSGDRPDSLLKEIQKFRRRFR